MFAWLIMKDHLEPGSKYEGRFVIAGHISETKPDATDLALMRELSIRTRTEGQPFRLYDDDQELYYDGRFLELTEDNDPECMFAPLDWAMANDGCVRIDYLDAATGKWETL